MSLSAVILAKVLWELPWAHRRVALAMVPLAVVGFAGSPSAFRVNALFGFLALCAAAFTTACLAVVVWTGYAERNSA